MQYIEILRKQTIRCGDPWKEKKKVSWIKEELSGGNEHFYAADIWSGVCVSSL